MRLTSISPTSGYPGLDLYGYVYLVRTVQNCLYPFGHRLLQPGLCVRRLFCITLDDHLVVTNEYWHGPWTLVPTIPQQGQRQLQTIGSGTLDRSVEAVGQPLNVLAAPAGERPGLGISAQPGSPFVIVPSLYTGVGLEEAPTVKGSLFRAHLYPIALESIGL
jgi:hypothetical protein